MKGASKVPSQISNIIIDIIVLALAIKNIKFMYCNKYTNKLADTVARKAHHYTV